MTVAPTLDEVRRWPSTIDVGATAQALGVSRSHAYEAIRQGILPVRTIRVGGRIRVITASLVALLADTSDGEGAA